MIALIPGRDAGALFNMSTPFESHLNDGVHSSTIRMKDLLGGGP
jgi:hypothetical protein